MNRHICQWSYTWLYKKYSTFYDRYLKIFPHSLLKINLRLRPNICSFEHNWTGAPTFKYLSNKLYILAYESIIKPKWESSILLNILVKDNLKPIEHHSSIPSQLFLNLKFIKSIQRRNGTYIEIIFSYYITVAESIELQSWQLQPIIVVPVVP